ncbi:PREDICTED: uncharacterized protein C6orf118 homolog [Condylura cristata]|uniref:uncharacterized protein C6orf118 homolog n=1 Tax=Condylura cristata TaxID=143302 RepID=UPI0006431E30|nr:PREDICTED: uncharacterized protein C6orf118 homolog [Condylura cristata]
MAEEPKPKAHLSRRHCETPGLRTLCNLTQLLDMLQEGHRDDVRLYTCGHLNPNKLYRPPETILRHWANAHRPEGAAGPGVGRPCAGTVAKMKDALAYFAVRTALRPSDGRDTPLFRYLNPVKPSSEDALVPQARRAGPFPEWREKEELRMPEVKVLRCRRPGSSRQGAAPPAQDRFQYVSSYLAGVTKADQYRAFLRFQKDVLAKQDLLENDFTGSKAVLVHERKLEQELQKLCVCPHELGRLSVFAAIFEDICSSSLIFGGILKEIKAFLDYLRGMERRPVRTPEVQQAQEQLRQLVSAVQAALARNEGHLLDQTIFNCWQIIRNYVRQCLKKNRISEQDQEDIWTFMNEFVKDRDGDSQDAGKVADESLQPPCT